MGQLNEKDIRESRFHAFVLNSWNRRHKEAGSLNNTVLLCASSKGKSTTSKVLPTTNIEYKQTNKHLLQEQQPSVLIAFRLECQTEGEESRNGLLNYSF